MVRSVAGRPVGPTMLLGLALLITACGLVAGCNHPLLGEPGVPSGRISNLTSRTLVITYQQPNGSPEPVFDQPLASGGFSAAPRPFERYYDRLVNGCLGGTLLARTEQGAEVARFDGLCSNQTWEIREAVPSS